jgi:hypothetical protein
MCSDKYKDEDKVLGILPEPTSVLRTTYLMREYDGSTMVKA